MKTNGYISQRWILFAILAGLMPAMVGAGVRDHFADATSGPTTVSEVAPPPPAQ